MQERPIRKQRVYIMKWIKHDTDANQDAKLQNVLLDYGLEGYGLYWYCIELIAGKVDKDNITFELEHDARIIARNTGSTPQKVEEMMKYFVDVGLFESSVGVITCIKLARRLDKSMTSNAQMREIIDNFKSHDGVMTQSELDHDKSMIESEKPMQDKNRLDKNRLDKKNSNSPTDGKPPAVKKFTDDDVRFSEWFYQGLLEINPNHKKPNFETAGWADSVRLMREQDRRTYDEMTKLFQWVHNDNFWKAQILSPKKLREKWDQLTIKMNQPQTGSVNPDKVDYVTPLLQKMASGEKRY